MISRVSTSVKSRLRTTRSLLFGLLDRLTIPQFAAVVNNTELEASSNSDIAELLPLIYTLAIVKNPQHILELGTRGGESTKALTKVCRQLGISGYSVDLSPAPAWLASHSNWHHFVEDDVSFGKALSSTLQYPNGDKFHGLDFLFLDTSHEYDHTVEELETYWPLLNRYGILVLHDSNLTSKLTRKLNGTPNRGWNNQRGVTAAVEDFFQVSIREDEFGVQFSALNLHFLLSVPWNNGMLVIQKK